MRKVNFKPKIALLLAVAILISTMPFTAYAGASYNGNDPFWVPTIPGVDDNTEWNYYKKAQGLGNEIPSKIVSPTGSGNLLFNRELWEEKGVVVYGDHSLVAPNTYKAVAGGYYGGGEYRYHGYDVSGNKHNNTDFPPDVDSSAKATEKSWVYQPWDRNAPQHSFYKKYVGDIGIYNDAVIDQYNQIPAATKNTIAKWINEGQDWDIQRSYKDLAGGNTDLVNFMTVQTAPTPYQTGQGTMIHIDKTGSPWYQTFSVKQIAQKQMTPILADIPVIATTSYDGKGDVVLAVQVTGVIQDQDYYSDPVLRTAWYTRYDISFWEFELKDSITGKRLTQKGSKASSEKGYTEFTVTIPRSAYEPYLKSGGVFDVSFEGVARAKFSNGNSNQGTAFKVKTVAGTDAPPDPVVTMPDPPFNPILFEVSAPREILDVWNFPVTLTVEDDSHAVDRYVTIDGVKLSEADEARFINGTYKFPEIREDRVYDYTITYVHEDNSLYFYQAYVIVYDSVPRASVRVDDPGKVNRKVSATADYSITSDFLEAHSNVQITSFTVTSPDGRQVYMGADTSSLKEFLVKEAGTVNINVTVWNEYGSRSYTHQVYEDADYAPDIVAIVWNSEMSRLDTLDMLAEGASLDGDTVGNLTYEIRYDNDQDGVGDTVVTSGSWDSTVKFQPDKLGWYDITLTVKESFGQPTIEKHITPEDYRTTTIKREFYVDNLVPMSKIYTDIEFNYPVLDVVFLTDEAIPREQNDYIRNNNVDITNSFRLNALVADIDLWDLHTYEFTQTAYKRIHSGGSYPANTTPYSADGYIGALTRYNVTNYPYTVDEGSYKTRTLSKTITMSQDSYWEVGRSDGRDAEGTGTVTIYYAASYSYSDGEGYSGSTTGSGSAWIVYVKGKEVSSGNTSTPSVSGTAYKTETYWDSNYVTYDDYYGDYSGTVYKYVKQQYSPELQTESRKYLVYIATGSLNNIADLGTVHNVARDATIILVGAAPLKDSANEDIFIENTGDTAAIIDQIIALAKEANPVINERAILVGETFTMNSTDIDAEGDPITVIGYQYVHDPDYFDNPLGMEPGAYAAYDDDHYTATVKNSFSKPGKFTVYRLVKDEPEDFDWMGKESNKASLDIMVHRKPIASATLDWDYNAGAGKYKTVWVDHSYDPDFQYSDANRGIINRSIRYRLTSSPTWIYEIPDNLAPGSYTLEYLVQDKHGVWSDPYVFNFALSTDPQIQLNASLRALKSNFSIASIPASESVEFYGIWTRYPYNVRLEMALYNNTGSSWIGAVKTVNFTEGVTGVKTENDIKWNNVPYEIPATVADGNYIMKITAVNVSDPSITQTISFPVTANTPINLASPFTSLAGSDSNVIIATTSIYPTSVTVELFRGTPRAITLNMSLLMSDGETKTWQVAYTAPGSATLPEGNYQARFTATNPSGKFEILDRTFELQHLRVTAIEIVGDWTYWNGQRNLLGQQMALMPHRFMGYEAVHVNAVVAGNPDRVEVRFSPALEAMVYTNSLGHTYYYADEMKKTVSFPLAMTSGNNKDFAVKYTLPLANQTMDYHDQRLRPPYWVEVTAYKGSSSHSMKITDIDFTGTIHDRYYVQPE